MLTPRTKARTPRQRISHRGMILPLINDKIINEPSSNGKRKSLNIGRNDDVKYEDIVLLNKRKQRLISEKNNLSRKLNELDKMMKDPEKFIKNIDRNAYVDLELNKMKSITDEAYNNLINLKQSDRAALISELQDESLIYHQELKRVQAENRSTEENLRKLEDQISKLKLIYTKSNYFALISKLNELEKKIKSQLVINQNYKNKIDRMKTRQQNAATANSTMNVEIEELRKRIRREEDFIKRLDQQMETEDKKYMERVRKLSSA